LKGKNRYRRNNSSAVASSGGGTQYYKVRKGDSLSKISQRTGVSIDRLCKLNGITRRTTLRINQVLKCS
jgi:LysM repeat protein